jgi:hypothetical protein
VGSRHANDPIASALECCIAAGIEMCAGMMIAAIHFDDHPHTGRAEISDVATDDELAPECDAQATAAQLIPQARFRRGEVLTHALRAKSELLLMLRDLATLIR